MSEPSPQFSFGLRPIPKRLNKSSIERTTLSAFPVEAWHAPDGKAVLRWNELFGQTKWHPDDEPNLHRKFSKLNEANASELAEFATKYGLLVEEFRRDHEATEPVELWKWHIQRVRFALDLASCLRKIEACRVPESDGYAEFSGRIHSMPKGRICSALCSEDLSKVCGWEAEFFHAMGGQYEDGASDNCVEHEGMSREDVGSDLGPKVGLLRLRMLLDRIVSEPLGRTTTLYVSTERGAIVFEPTCLLGAVYVCLLRWVTSGKMQIERSCKRCGRNFQPVHGHDRYCRRPDCSAGAEFDHNRSVRRALANGGVIRSEP